MKPGRKVVLRLKPEGDGAVISLPADFLAAIGVRSSEQITLTLRGDHTMVIRPIEEDDELLADDLAITATVARRVG
jgi:antitoxin component of MazEF toxin-antitoxin module